MKSASIILLGIGLAFSSLASDVAGVNELTETLSQGPWAELPVRVVAVVRHAKTQDRKDVTIAAVKAALGLNPAAATAVVSSIARAVPAMAEVAAEAAAAAQPKQAPEIAVAAVAANRAAVSNIVVGVCAAAPDQYESVAVAVSVAAPNSGKDILQAVGKAEPELKTPIDQVLAEYNGYLPSVATVLAEARPIAAADAGDSADAKFRRDRPTNTTVHRVDKYPPPVGGFGGTPPPHYHRP